MQNKAIDMHMFENDELKYLLCNKKFEPIMQQYLDTAVKIIVKYLGNSCMSIYLIGSFGRDEGALYCDEEIVQPLRDFDILAVTSKPIDSKTIMAMEEEIHKKLAIPSPTKGTLDEFYIWITSTTLNNLVKGSPLLKYYELKVASKHLYGIDVRGLINIGIEDLSLYNGILIFFSKVYGLLALYPLYVKSHKRLINYVYEILKAYTEISTVFSLLDHSVYRTSFSKRCLAFYKKYSNKSPELFKFIPGLNTYLVMACKRRKLLDDELVNSIDLRLLTIHVVETLDKVISLYIRAGYGINTPLSGFSKSDESALNKVGLITLAEFFSSYLRKKGVRWQCLARIMGFIISTLYIPVANATFVVKARRSGFPMKLRLIFSSKNHYVYLTYISLNFLKLLAYNDDKNLNGFRELFLRKYLSPDYVAKLRGIKDSNMEKELVVKLLRLADVSLHRKTF